MNRPGRAEPCPNLLRSTACVLCADFWILRLTSPLSTMPMITASCGLCVLCTTFALPPHTRDHARDHARVRRWQKSPQSPHPSKHGRVGGAFCVRTSQNRSPQKSALKSAEVRNRAFCLPAKYGGRTRPARYQRSSSRGGGGSAHRGGPFGRATARLRVGTFAGSTASSR